MKRAHEGEGYCPNPVFVECLEGMIKDAVAKKEFHLHLIRPLGFLKSCPYRLDSVEDCRSLPCFGKKMCELLDKKLKEHGKTDKLPLDGDEDEENVGGKRAKISKNRPTNLDASSAAPIILTVMYNMQEESENQGYLLKEDIVSEAQQYLDYVMKKNPDENYSVESAMSALIAKHYVVEKSPEKYNLTDSGVDFVTNLLTEYPANPLFEKWLTELLDQTTKSKNIKRLIFKKALSSLQKCPIKLESGKDCSILQHFGDFVCDVLDRKLKNYEKTKKLPLTTQSSNIRGKGDQEEEQAKNDLPADKKSDQPKKARGRGAKK